MTKLDWLTARKSGIGGSDVGTVLGLNSYKTPYQLWKEKVSDEEPTEIDSLPAKLGNLYEPVISQLYEEKTGYKVRNDNKIRIHKEHSCLLVNLDRVIVANDERGTGILEIKTTNALARKHWDSAIPIDYYCQVQHELSVTGYQWAELALLVDNREFEIIPIARDENYIQMQNQALVEWWNAYVVTNVPPPMTAAEYSFVKPAVNSKIEVDSDTLKLINELIEVKKQYKVVEAHKSSLEDKIKQYMGENEGLTCNSDIIATWKQFQQNRVDTKKFKESFPEVARLVLKESSYRKFDIKL